ncbi:hypothetical protein ACETAC_04700 [Aceticella autotrophica]|uniref:Iron-only hydrogenase system regulator n=1 Tax=Aceticella autotrophica TaxID=2755338 RepID=A0A975GBG7_9THEO|nr:hypothetical protein [Aceticella autotrophica]QSZ28152.1 hypothetical protein ACETAC_04700 [Aceticella autotrophica]
MNCYNLMGIVISKRCENAVKVQEILTKYGCIIKVRLGLHESNDNVCSQDGFIVLQLCGSKDEISNLCAELNSIKGVTADIVTIEAKE